MSRTPAQENREILPSSGRMSAAARIASILMLAALMIGSRSAPILGQAAAEGGDWAAAAPAGIVGLSPARYSDMEMLYERTIFGVDVLMLSLRFDARAAEQIGRLVDGRSYDSRVGDQVVGAALDSQGVLVSSHFLRDLTLKQYLDGLRDNLAVARDEGFLTAAERQELIYSAEVSYEPMRERGIRSGDRVWYRIDGESLHVAYQAVEGAVLLTQKVEGSKHRSAVLGSYLAPGSDFRDGLVRSAFDR